MRTLPFLLLLACTGKGDDTGADYSGIPLSDCDPVAPTHCGLPFPSTFYMAEDPTTASGWRIHLGPTTLPMNANGYQPAPDFWNEKDGWSILTPAMAHFPGVSLEGTVGHDDIGASVEDGSATILVDVETGERVPHFVELDVSQELSDDSLLKIRPVSPLRHGARYVVGIRGLHQVDGTETPASEAYTSLRDGIATTEPDVENRRAVYEDVVFPALEAQGWDRGETLLAWDFVTGSQEGMLGRSKYLRDQTLDLVAGGPAYEITEIEEAPREGTAFRVHGTMTLPLWTEEDKSGTVLTRDADGMPYQNGETTVPFTVIVPDSVVAAGVPAPIIQYGHGLLGDQGEVETGWISDFSNQYGYIFFAVDWTGMKEQDVGAVTLMLVEAPDRFAIIPERSQQGFTEFVAAMQLMTTELVDDPALQGTGGSLIDPTRRFYYGNSQGGIMGGAYLALAKDIERGVLGVPGTPYDLLLTRSQDFEEFFLVFQTMVPEPAQVALLIGFMQTLWDPAEASGFANTMNQQPWEDTPAKQVLLQAALGDHQVTHLGAEIMARAYGAKLIAPATQPVWGLEEVEGPWTGSALVEWDYGVPEPYENTPPEVDPDPHEFPRRSPAGQAQVDEFLRTGVVEHKCDGICDGVNSDEQD